MAWQWVHLLPHVRKAQSWNAGRVKWWDLIITIRHCQWLYSDTKSYILTKPMFKLLASSSNAQRAAYNNYRDYTLTIWVEIQSHLSDHKKTTNCSAPINVPSLFMYRLKITEHFSPSIVPLMWNAWWSRNILMSVKKWVTRLFLRAFHFWGFLFHLSRMLRENWKEYSFSTTLVHHGQIVLTRSYHTGFHNAHEWKQGIFCFVAWKVLLWFETYSH